MIGDGSGKRPWVYATMVKGAFQRLHRHSAAVLVPIYLIAPWIEVHGQRLVLFDLGERRFYLFGATFSAMDTRFLLVLLLLGGFSLFLFTSLLGRIWCGYLCPQTVFLEEWVRRVEQWIEGNRGARRKLDQAPWTASKIAKKLTKWTVFLVMSAVLGLTFVGYFTDTPALFTLEGSATAYAVAGFFTAAWFVDFVWFREQFCNYLCPYARFQGALTDSHTLTIGYDAARGEPRQPKGKRQAREAYGDCVSCNLCVAACPQGIDIREGYQLECITCGHCIDACTGVMAKKGLPSLITYTTEARLAGKQSGRRLRPYIYGAALLACIGVLVAMLQNRAAIDASVTRAPGELYRILDDGMTQNAFRAHLLNNDSEEREFELHVEGLDGATVVVPFEHVRIAAGEEQVLPVFVLAPASGGARSVNFEWVIRAGEEEIRRPGVFQTGPGDVGI